MSRKARVRNTSRVGGIHLCAVCVQNAGGYGGSEDGHSQQLTWMFEIPPDSDTYARLGGRARTWFCRPCFESVCATDPIFADRNRDLELKDPAWWTHPATEAQISYLCNLLDQRVPPDKLRDEIESRVETATKGEVARWLDALQVAPCSSMEHDAFRVPYLSDKAPEDEFHGQAVKTVA